MGKFLRRRRFTGAPCRGVQGRGMKTPEISLEDRMDSNL